MLVPIKTSYLNISGVIHDSEYISLANVHEDKIYLDERTVYLTSSEKKQLNQEEVLKFEEAVYINLNKSTRKMSLVCDLSIKAYQDRRVVTHELVLPDTIQGMMSNFQDYNCEASPAFLIHDAQIDLKSCLDTIPEDYLFENDEMITYVFQGEKAKEVLRKFDKLERLYVADGHHRITASSLSPVKETVSVCVMAATDVEISSIIRVIPEVKERAFSEAIDKLSRRLIPNERELKKGIVHLYRRGETQTIKLKEYDDDAFQNNDVYRLNTQVISYAFRIFDTGDLKYFLNYADFECYASKHPNCVGFETFPVSKHEFMDISQRGLIMPPKSTLFNPKFPSFYIFKKYKEFSNAECKL